MGQDKPAGVLKWILSKLMDIMLKCLVAILSVGPIPNHIAFIMDGNRRFAKKHKLKDVSIGHRLGSQSLTSVLRFCCILGVKQFTAYAFSIDNFRRRREEVDSLMDLLQEKMDLLLEEDSIVSQHGIRVHFAGDLTLLNESLRLTARRLMEATSKNSKCVFSICLPYTSTDEITRGVQKACEERLMGRVSLEDIERNLDMSIALNPDIIIRTSGETRLSNFLLWQSSRCLLYSTPVEWPEFGARHLLWAILNFQRMHSYLRKKI